MILLIHKNKVVVEVLDLKSNTQIDNTLTAPIKAIFNLANKYQDRILIWCEESLKSSLNLEGIKASFQHTNTMLSYSKNNYLLEQIGYIEDSPFLKINKHVKYPTWLMSSCAGAIHASQLLKFENKIEYHNSFDFALNSIAKLGMPQGLFCYSEPKFFKSNSFSKVGQSSVSELFKFVKKHYKGIWSFLLLINFIIYERRFPLLPFFKTLFIKKNSLTLNFDLKLITQSQIDKKASIDVIIPTLGRKAFLHDVLIDLSNQTLLPEYVIIVEQSEEKETELDFIKNKEWPFKIIHEFINQTGACNARNLALQKVSSKYVYLADDDNKFGNTLLQEIVTKMEFYKFNAISMSYLKANEVEKNKNALQYSTFGGGNSVILSKFLEFVAFDMALEFGYGEDADFGMQLRGLGVDVIYVPDIKILHLSAPTGGFRTKFEHPWKSEALQPKPSPTVFFNRKKNTTERQLLGYKTTLFLKFYKDQEIKNPLKYLKTFKKQWNLSVSWANQLKSKSKL